jgi:hypothetical protein
MPPLRMSIPCAPSPRVAPGVTAYLSQPASEVESTRIPGPMVELSATFWT